MCGKMSDHEDGNNSPFFIVFKIFCDFMFKDVDKRVIFTAMKMSI